jgi:hypothetical protein
MPDILVQPVEKSGLDLRQRSFTCPVFWTLNREGPENLALVLQLPGIIYCIWISIRGEA